MSICKTLRKYSASNCEGGSKTQSNRRNRHSKWRPVIPDVDLLDTWKTFRVFLWKGAEDAVESNESSQQMTTRHTGCRFSRQLENIPQVSVKGDWKCCRIDTIRQESNDSSPQLTTRHIRCRFARHLENIPQVSVKGGCRWYRIDAIQLESNESS